MQGMGNHKRKEMLYSQKQKRSESTSSQAKKYLKTKDGPQSKGKRQMSSVFFLPQHDAVHNAAPRTMTAPAIMPATVAARDV